MDIVQPNELESMQAYIHRMRFGCAVCDWEEEEEDEEYDESN